MNEITIERLGHRGDGIAPGSVYVPRVLPGETVTGDIDGGRLATPKVITPSRDRVSAPCPHYNACGGCALQHASDHFVAGWKQDIVSSALAAHDVPAPIAALHTSPPASRRRATLSGRRTKKGAIVGFHAPSSGILTPVPNCQILSPEILKALPYFEALTCDIASRKGELRFAATVTDTGLDVGVDGGKPLDLPLRERLASLSAIADLARLSYGGDTVVERRMPVIRIGTAPIPIPPAAFLQATRHGERALQAAVGAAIGSAKKVVDLFAGCGTFALDLARNADVHAVEGDSNLLAALDAGWRHGTDLHRVTTQRRDLFRQPLTPEDLRSTDAVVIDPPRAGAEAQFRMLAKARVPCIASVSCNPVTFARDSAILTKAGYKLSRIDVVDQFRWSPHVELVGAFSLA